MESSLCATASGLSIQPDDEKWQPDSRIRQAVSLPRHEVVPILYSEAGEMTSANAESISLMCIQFHQGGSVWAMKHGKVA